MAQCILFSILKHIYTKDATKDSLEPLLDNKPRFGIFKDIEDGMFIFLDSEKKYADALEKTTELHEFKARYRETITGRMNILHLVATKTMLKEGHVKVEKEKRDVLLIDCETDIFNEFARMVENSRYTNDKINIAVLSWSILKWNSFAGFIEMQCEIRNSLLKRLIKSTYSLDNEIKNFIIEFENTKMELVDICECYDENLGDDFDIKFRDISAFIDTFNAGVSQSKSNAFKRNY